MPVPGSRPSFLTKPPPFSCQHVSLQDTNHLTFEIHALALEEMQRLHLGPLFTPPSLHRKLQSPGASGGAPDLYAFDKMTGAEAWRGAAPFRANANQMTCRARSGRQFVVIATGAGSDAALVAFARPE